MPCKRIEEIIGKVKSGKAITNKEANCLILELERLHTIAAELEDDLEFLAEEKLFLNQFY